MSEKIEDKELLNEILWDDRDGYTKITEVAGYKGRWSTYIETVFKRTSDDKLFIMGWQRAATEYQEHQLPEVALECESYIEPVTKYRPVK